MSRKKNCFNCIHLAFIDDQSFEIQDGGYYCEKREYQSDREENSHLHLLKFDRYKETHKSCCELKEEKK